MEYKDYYKILGVEKKATQPEIKKAYRALAIKYHPDKNYGNKEAEEQFKLANEANSVLSDPEKRKKYDELGENWQQYGKTANQSSTNSNGGSPFQRANTPFEKNDDTIFSDFFEQFFGRQTKAGNPSNPFENREFKGGDYETEMQLTLEEAYKGTNRIIQVENEKLRITTKPGLQDGQVLKIKSKGAEGSSLGNRGDLFVKVKVYPDLEYKRNGDDLFKTHKIDVYTAVLGGDTLVDTFSGQLKFKVAAGTQNEKTIKLKGKGMPNYENPTMFGDLTIQLLVKIPIELTEKQKTLFEELKTLS
jgi:curved DNA-binding protein